MMKKKKKIKMIKKRKPKNDEKEYKNDKNDKEKKIGNKDGEIEINKKNKGNKNDEKENKNKNNKIDEENKFDDKEREKKLNKKNKETKIDEKEIKDDKNDKEKKIDKKNKYISISSKKQEKKEILKNLIFKGKNHEKNNLILPKIKPKTNDSNNNSINIITIKKSKLKINPIFSPQELIRKKNGTFYNNKMNKNGDIIFLKNKNTFNIKNPEKDDSSSTLHIMNYSHKDIENNFIKYDIHYFNHNIYSKSQSPQNKSINTKSNYTQTSNKVIIPKIKTHFKLNTSYFFNKYNNETENENKKGSLKKQKEYSRNIYRRICNGFNRFNKSIIKPIFIKKINLSKNDNIMLRRYKSSLLAIKEYFNIK